MADAFISYSRRDAEFVTRLQQALEARGKNAWVDVEGIRDAELFPAALLRAIEGSDAFVFVISPDSVRSDFCVHEVDHAVELNKRIVPLSLKPVPDGDLPDPIRFRNWIPVDDGLFDEGVARLLQAIDTDLDWEHQHTRLTVKALEWDQSGRDKSSLLRGSELAAAEHWLAAGVDKDPGPNAIEQEYLLAARAARQRRQRLTAGASLGIAAIAVGLLIFALISRSQALHAARVALARQLGAEAVSEPRIDRALLLAREAVKLNRDNETTGTLLATLLRSPAAIETFALPLDARPQNIALRPDGRALAVDDNTGEIRFFNPLTHQPLGKPLTDPISTGAPTYSPDGSLIAYSAGTGTSAYVAVRDAHTLRLLHRLPFDHRWLTTPTADLLNATGAYLFSPRDRDLYYPYWVVGPTGTAGPAYLDRWSLSSGRLLSTTALGPGPVLAARLIGTGQRLVIVNAKQTAFYDARSLRRLRSQPITPAPSPTASADISPDGRHAIFGLPTGSVSFVDLTTGRTRQGTGGHGGAVDQAVYSPDGRFAVTTGEDQKVIVWDPASAQPVEVLTGHAGPVHGVAFTPDGKTLYTSSLDGVVLGWDLGGTRRFGEPFTVGPGLSKTAAGNPEVPGTPPLAFSPDGSRFAVRIGQSTIGLFSARTLRAEGSFNARAFVTALAWSPRKQELALGTYAGAVALWSVSGRPRLERSLAGLPSHGPQQHAVQAVAFSADGHLVAATDREETATAPGAIAGRLAIWSAATGSLVASPRELHQAGDSVAFAKRGNALAVGLDLGRVLIIDSGSGRVRRTITTFGVADRFSVTALAFAPNGTLATGSWDGVVQLWNAATGRALGHPVQVAGAPVASISVDPTVQRFATTGGGDGSAKIWFTSTLQQEGANLQSDPGQWGNAAFSPNGRTLLVLYANGNGFRWPATVGAWEQHACAVAGRNFTREEWARFVSGYSYTRVCPR